MNSITDMSRLANALEGAQGVDAEGAGAAGGLLRDTLIFVDAGSYAVSIESLLTLTLV